MKSDNTLWSRVLRFTAALQYAHAHVELQRAIGDVARANIGGNTDEILLAEARVRILRERIDTLKSELER